MKDILNQLFKSRTLSKAEAKNVLVRIANGEFNTSQIVAFLTVFQLRNITIDELQGFRDALLEMCVKVDLSEFETIDLCGTGGDGKDTFNISTLASFVVAGAGKKVVKHGNYGVSSTCGSSNVLEYFGYEFSSNQDKLRSELDNAGICFLHAPKFNPAMKNIAPIRKELGLKTFFNMLGPMVNPARPNNQLVGVFSLELARMYNYIYQDSNVNYTIVHSIDGYDEISLTSDVKLHSNKSDSIVSPELLGFNKIHSNEIVGGKTVQESSETFLSILNGKGSEAQNNVVIANASLALNCYYPNKEYSDCVEYAKDSLFGLKALNSFKTLIN